VFIFLFKKIVFNFKIFFNDLEYILILKIKNIILIYFKIKYSLKNNHRYYISNTVKLLLLRIKCIKIGQNNFYHIILRSIFKLITDKMLQGTVCTDKKIK
jgi:hypothetical protein